MHKKEKFIVAALIIGAVLWTIVFSIGLYLIAELLGNDIIVWEGPKIVLINDVPLLMAILATGALIGIVTYIVLVLLIASYVNRNRPID